MSPDEHDSTAWTAQQRAALVLDILRGATTAGDAARASGIAVVEIERWIARFLRGAENALRGRPRSQVALREQEIAALSRTVDALALDLKLYKEATSLPSVWPERVDPPDGDDRLSREAGAR